jgi:hypothetical protein
MSSSAAMQNGWMAFGRPFRTGWRVSFAPAWNFILFALARMGRMCNNCRCRGEDRLRWGGRFGEVELVE